MKTLRLTLLTALMLVIAGCEPEPRSIEAGNDQCAYCRMMISELEFASQLLNKQGRSFKFDSVECMAAYDLTTDNPENVHSLWVPDFHDPQHWIRSDEAFYLKSETLRSPMGLSLSAYASREQAEEMRSEYGGELISYEQVKQLVEKEWLSENDSAHHH